MKNFNVRLSDGLHYRFKVACTLQGVEMSEVVRQFIEEYIAKLEKRKLIPLWKKR
jgi:predicted HicB family RNase H-like nuclease